MTPEPSQHVSAIDLDLHQMGDLDPERSRALLSHLSQCEPCRARQQELASAYGEFSAEVFPRTAPKLRSRPVRAVVPLHRRPLTWAPALAAAAAILLVVKTGMFSGVTERADGEIGVKGTATLSLSARRDGQPFAVDGKTAELRAGDELRFVVTSADPAHQYLLIVSVDGAGKANVYYPFDGKQSAKLAEEGRFEVPGSIVLDETPGPERVFAVFSPEPIEASQVAAQLTSIGKLGHQGIRDARLELSEASIETVLIEKTP
jgi:hypothetical protein